MAYHKCYHTSGVVCDEQKTSCRWCGWHPQEIERRKKMIEDGKLHKSALGKEWLRLKASERG